MARHRKCVYRRVRYRDGLPDTAYCTAAPSGPAWPYCTYCKDEIPRDIVKFPRKEQP